MVPTTRENNPAIYYEEGRQRVWGFAKRALTMPHDPNPRALGAVRL